jgi:hypothetical protein
LQRAWEAYADAYTAAQAVDHPASFHAGKSDAERAQLRAERWPKVLELHAQYAKLLEKATQLPSRPLTPTQPRLFADAWPEAFAPIAERFPRRPYVSQDLRATVVRPLDQAAAWRYLQHNPPAYAHLLVIDYDGDAGAPALEVWRSAGLPPPAWVACTPGTPKGHLAWALAAPVCTTSAGHLAPLRYLAAIEQAYKAAVQGDQNYVGLLTKNPIYNGEGAWHLHWVDPTPRTLEDLARAVQLPKPTAKKPSPVAPVGFGRKVHTFEAVRHWAYSAVSSYWDAKEETWHQAVRDQVELVNRTFTEPLPESHLRSIAKSIARWVWRRFTPLTKHQLVMATHTPEVQAMRGRQKGAKVRAALLDQAKDMAAAGMCQRDIAAQLGVDQATVSRWLRRS